MGNLLFYIIVIIVALIAAFTAIRDKSNERRRAKKKPRRLVSAADRAGRVGELNVAAVLDLLDKDKYIVLNDIMLQGVNGNTSQIDHVVVSKFGVFVIETKNYKGWIFGNDQNENWTQVLFDGEKKYFRNPVKQNSGHVRTLSHVLRDMGTMNFISIVVFDGSASLEDVSSSVPVVYLGDLISTISLFSGEERIDQQKMNRIALRIKTLNITDEKRREYHVASIQRRIEESKTAARNHICPRCGGSLRLREGKYGEFYGCSNYPLCNFTMRRD